MFHSRQATGRAVHDRLQDDTDFDKDRTLTELVGRALRATGFPALRNVDIEINRDLVILRGRLPSYHQKQLAQASAQQVQGVCGIVNHIEVISCR